MKNSNLTHFCKDVSKSVNLRSKIHKICVGVLPAAAIITFASTVMYWNSRNYGLVLAYAGKEFATVQNESMFEKAAQLAQEQISSNKGIDTAIPSPECKLTLLNDSNDCISPSAVKDKLLQESQAAVENACGLYVDGQLLGIVKDRNILEDLLRNTLENAKNGNNDASSEFVERVEVLEGLYLSSEICDITALNIAVSKGIEYETEYVVQQGDTLENIAEKFNVSVSSICENNAIKDNKVELGQNLSIVYYNKALHVRVYENKVSEVEVPYASSVLENPNDYIGTNKLIQTGKNGIRTITEKVTYIDGTEISREGLSDVVTTQPIEERVSIGTKKREEHIPQKQEGLCWPVPFTRNITSVYGPRDGAFHKGIDIAAFGVGGKDIVSIDDGIVEVVSNGGGYGNFIIVRHDNNVRTLYAHCSSVVAKSGQRVSKGQKIALVGSTGNSTGNHLHFEIIVNGKNVDPMKYFS